MNHAFKELIRRQTHSAKEFEELGSEFLKYTEKMKVIQSYQPIVDLFNQIHKWFVDRLEKGVMFTDSVITQKKSYETLV